MRLTDHLSTSRPAGFRHNEAKSVADEYSPANVVIERSNSEKIGITTSAIKKVCPGAENIIWTILNEMRLGCLNNSFI